MYYKPILTLCIKSLFLAFIISKLSTILIAQKLSTNNNIPVIPQSSTEATSNLITNNPFVPKNSTTLDKNNKPNGPQSTVNKTKILEKYLQFRSILIIDNKKYFSIFNKRTNKSFWITEGETIENFRVTYYSPKNNTISITDGINTEIIPIITANETPLSVIGNASQTKEDIAETQIPGAKNNQKKDGAKPPQRRRVIPVKR